MCLCVSPGVCVCLWVSLCVCMQRNISADARISIIICMWMDFFSFSVCVSYIRECPKVGDNQRKWARFAGLRDMACETGLREPGDMELLVPVIQGFYPPHLKRLGGLLVASIGQSQGSP